MMRWDTTGGAWRPVGGTWHALGVRDSLDDPRAWELSPSEMAVIDAPTAEYPNAIRMTSTAAWNRASRRMAMTAGVVYRMRFVVENRSVMIMCRAVVGAETTATGALGALVVSGTSGTLTVVDDRLIGGLRHVTVDWTPAVSSDASLGRMGVGPGAAADLTVYRAYDAAPKSVAPTGLYATRDPLLRPFAPDSLWNVPIATGATLTPAYLPPVTHFYVDPVFLTSDLAAPLQYVAIRTNGAAFGGQGAGHEAYPADPATNATSRLTDERVPVANGVEYTTAMSLTTAYLGVENVVAGDPAPTPLWTANKPATHNGCAAHFAVRRGALAIFQHQVASRGPANLTGPILSNSGWRYPNTELHTDNSLIGAQGWLPMHSGPHDLGTATHADSKAEARDPSRLGAHGGGRGSSIGGLIRVHDLEGPDEDSIRHAICGTVPIQWFRLNSAFGNGTSKNNPWADPARRDRGDGHRWPAATADSGYDDTNSTNYYSGGGLNSSPWNVTVKHASGNLPSLDMQNGALLTLPANFNIAALTCPVARRIAYAMRDYGMYCMDVTGRWNYNQTPFALEIAYGPKGVHPDPGENVSLYVYRRWGVNLIPNVGGGVPTARDNRYMTAMNAIFAAAQVVANNAFATPGGGAIGAARRRDFTHPPFNWFGGRITVGGSVASQAVRDAVTLWRRIDGGAWAQVTADLFNRALANRAAPADAAAGYVIFSDLRGALTGSAPVAVHYQLRSGALQSAAYELGYDEARVVTPLELA